MLLYNSFCLETTSEIASFPSFAEAKAQSPETQRPQLWMLQDVCLCMRTPQIMYDTRYISEILDISKKDFVAVKAVKAIKAVKAVALGMGPWCTVRMPGHVPG